MKEFTRIILVISFLLMQTACSAGQLFGPTITPSPTSTPTSTATPTQTPTPTATFTPSPMPTQIGGGNGRLVMSLQKQFNASIFSEFNLQGIYNIFAINADGTGLTPITNGVSENNNIYIYDVSPDGHQILVGDVTQYLGTRGNKGSIANLYLINLDGSEPIIITDQLFISNLGGYTSAYWLSDGSKIIFIAWEGKERFIFVANSDGSEPQRISKLGQYPLGLYPTSDDNSIIWETGTAIGVFYGNKNPYRKTSLDGLNEEVIWEGITGDILVARKASRIRADNFIADLDLENRIYFSQTTCTPCEFLSPDGSKLLHLKLINANGRNSTWESVTLFSIPEETSTVIPLDGNELLFGCPQWSPDNRLLFYGNKVANMETFESWELPIKVDMADSVFWLP